MQTRRGYLAVAAAAIATASALGASGVGASTPPASGPAAGASDAIIRYQWGTPGGSNYDPHQAFNQFANIYLYPAYDRLTELTPEGEVTPMLAESWEFSDDNTALTLHLREDVVFQDGTPFNAEAVKANIERGQTLETSAVKADLASIAEVVVVDDFTVELHLSSPGASLPALLSDRAGMMVSPAAFDNEDIDLMPVGAGPYQVVEHVPGSVISYERFPDYWDPEAQTLGGVEITMQLDPEARLRAVIDGQAHGTSLNADQIGSAEDAGLAVTTQPSVGAFLLFVNMASPGLDTLEVRQAISMAIDRQGLADALHGGLCTPTNQIFPLTYWAGNPDVAVDEFDPDAAHTLLADAGFGDGLDLEAVVVNVPFYVAQLEALQAMLGEIGVNLTVTALEPTELLSRFSTGEADLYFTQYPGSVDPAKTVASIFAEQASLNPGHYSNAELDSLALEGLSVIEQAERAPVYQQLSAVAAADYFHIPICSPQNVYVLDESVQNFVPTLGGSIDFRGVTITE